MSCRSSTFAEAWHESGTFTYTDADGARRCDSSRIRVSTYDWHDYGVLILNRDGSLFADDGETRVRHIARRAERARTMTFNLLVHGEVETAPGRFEPGIVSSSMHPTIEDARARWAGWVAAGIYEEPYERPEIRNYAPTLGELLS